MNPTSPTTPMHEARRHELRILNGLHRGASLPLDHAPITLGAGDDADVVLADDGIATNHALLTPGESGWLLTAAQGTIHGAGSREAETVLEIASGGFARLGYIWLMIAPEHARWEAPPPMPEAGFDARAMLAEGAADDATAASGPEHQWRREPGHETASAPESEPAAAVGGAVCAAEADSGAAPQPSPRRAAPRHLRRAVLALSTLVMLGAATAYALTTHPVSGRPAPAFPGGASAAANGATAATAPPPTAADTAAGTGASAASGAAAPEPSRAELADLFRKRLADAELLNRFDLHLDAKAWSMQAHLDDEESARFERILSGFVKEHHIAFPVSAKAVTAEAMLPFKIDQVISGANPSLVTEDGMRLYVGDNYRGVQVLAIGQDRLSFFAKRKIDVLW
jgi:type III secretion protein D